MYPREKCALLKPSDGAEEGRHGRQRRVLLTAGSGECLVWSDTVRFVIDVGVERRKVIFPNRA